MAARGSNSYVSTINEATYGVTPGTPEMTLVPVITNNINLTKALFDDPTIYADSQVRNVRHGNKGVAGDVSFTYTVNNYDTWLESLMQNDWTADVLKFGEEKKSFTIERGFDDINQYAKYTGTAVDTFSIEVNTDGVVQATFSFVGQDMTIDGTSLDSTPTDASDEDPFVHLDGTFLEGDAVANNCTLLGISMEVSKNLDQIYCLGNDTIKEPTVGMIEVTGTITAFFEDADMLNKFINEVDSKLKFTLTDPTSNYHEFYLPQIVYTTANIDQADAGIIPIEMEFTAVYNTTEATTMSITRSA